MSGSNEVALVGNDDQQDSLPQLPTSRDPLTTATLILLSCVWLVVAFVVWLFEMAVQASFSTQIVSVSVFSATAGILLAFWTAWPRPLSLSLKQLHLGPWVGVGFAVVFGLTTLTWLLEVDNQATLIDPNFIVPASAVALVGVTSFAVFYRVTPRIFVAVGDRCDALLRGPAPTCPSALSVGVLWLISIAAYLVRSIAPVASNPESTASLDGSQATIVSALFGLGLLAALVGAWRFAKARTVGAAILLFAIVFSQVVIGLEEGTKEGALLPLIAAIFGYGLQRKIRIVPLVVIGTASVLFVVPFVTDFREQSNAGLVQSSTSSPLNTEILSEFADQALNSDRNQSAQQFMKRLSRVGDLAIIIQKTPSKIEYSDPTDLLWGPLLGLVPRSIWAEKPLMSTGYEMTRTYYELDLATHSAFTPYGDLWRRGGFLVVVIGMGVLGMFVRTIDSRSGDPASDPRLTFLPMLLFIGIVKAESDYVAMTAGFAVTILSAALASRLVTLLSGGEKPVGGEAV